MKRIIIKWIMVLFWMGLIFYFSSCDREKSTNQSRSVVEKVNVFGVYSEKEVFYEDSKVEEADRTLRKVAHVVEYFVLALLLCSTFSEYNLSVAKILLYAFVVCLIYSATDEVHQLMVSGRSGEIRDIIIDNIGNGFGLLIYYLFKRRRA